MADKHVAIGTKSFLRAFFPKPAQGLRPSRTTTLSGKPCPETEYERYQNIADVLNRSNHCYGFRFIAIHEKGSDASNDFPWVAAWPVRQAPPKKYITTQPTAIRPSPMHMHWLDLSIICFPPEERENDPFVSFREGQYMSPPTARLWREVLKRVRIPWYYQHRTFGYAIVFFGYYARILRVDRAGIICTHYIDCEKDASSLIYFLRNVSRVSPAERGVDPTVELIPHDSELAQTMRLRAQADKEPESPSDYPRELFEKTLKENEPWFKLSVGEGEDEDEPRRHFLVGAPRYVRNWEALDTGSRGYIALDIDDPDHPLVFLKDQWRITNLGYRREGCTLKRLNAAGVPYVPTLVCHGCVADQATLSDEVYRRKYGYASDSGLSMEHYRLVVAEIAKPIYEFTDSKGLLHAFKCCLIAHQKAMEVPLLHRDISVGNILLKWDSDLQQWQGMLSDWEVATDDSAGERCYGGKPMLSVGTGAFAAVRLLSAECGAPEREVEDDLEAFFHSLVCLVVQYLPSNLQNVPEFFQRYFSEDNFGVEKRGSYRVRCVRTGQISISTKADLRFAYYPPAGAGVRTRTRTGGHPSYNHPLNGVLKQILAWLRARYDFMPLMFDDMPYKDPDSQFTTQNMIDLLDAAVRDPKWPVGDKCEQRQADAPECPPIDDTQLRMVLPDDVPRPQAQERPEAELPATKRRRRA